MTGRSSTRSTTTADAGQRASGLAQYCRPEVQWRTCRAVLPRHPAAPSPATGRRALPGVLLPWSRHQPGCGPVPADPIPPATWRRRRRSVRPTADLGDGDWHGMDFDVDNHVYLQTSVRTCIGVAESNRLRGNVFRLFFCQFFSFQSKSRIVSFKLKIRS